MIGGVNPARSTGREALIIAAIASVLCLCSYRADLWFDAHWLRAIARVLNGALYGAAVVGFLVSGNAHQPAIWATTATLFVLYFSAIWIGSWVVQLAIRAARMNGPWRR